MDTHIKSEKKTRYAILKVNSFIIPKKYFELFFSYEST